MPNKLIEVLRKVIFNYEEQLDKLKQANNSSATKNKELIEKIRTDEEAIIEIDLEEIKNILKEAEVPEDELNNIMDNIKYLQMLIKLNKQGIGKFKITESQKIYRTIFLEKVDELIKRTNDNKLKNEQNILRLTRISEKYKSLLNMITNKQDTTFITDIDLLSSLFKETNLSESTKREILIEVMRYNQELYSKDLHDPTIKPRLNKLDSKDVSTIFKKYGYDFYQLNNDIRDDILLYCSKENMSAMFACLDKLGFPKFNLEKEGKKLSIILINCQPEIFEKMVLFNKEKGLSLKEQLQILPALIMQSKAEKKKKGGTTPPGPNESPIVAGKSEDYLKNVEFFESIGFDIRYIFDKCKELLVASNEKVKRNYEAYTAYGFTFKIDEFGRLTDSALSCLISNHFAEIADQFIEIDRNGYEYIKENKSYLTSIASADSLIFYNMYASKMNQDSEGNKMIPEGPFNEASTGRMTIKSHISRPHSSVYHDIPYRGLTEENKQEKTMTINVELENKELFDKVIEEAEDGDKEIKDYSSSIEEHLQELEEYTDRFVPVRYNFDGILISKVKVKRILNILKNYELDNLEDSLLYAITYNSIISEEDFNKLKNIVKGRGQK